LTDHMSHITRQMVRPRPGHRHIFAYDNLMDEAAIGGRCPDPHFVTTARYLSRRLIFNSDGVATIVPRRDFVVHGVIWEISKIGQVGLDIQLGVPSVFHRIGAFARGPVGELVISEFYAARNHRHGDANQGLLLEMMQLASLRSFPKEYLDELAGWRRCP
jgi:hypothetical protein